MIEARKTWKNCYQYWNHRPHVQINPMTIIAWGDAQRETRKRRLGIKEMKKPVSKYYKWRRTTCLSDFRKPHAQTNLTTLKTGDKHAKRNARENSSLPKRIKETKNPCQWGSITKSCRWRKQHAWSTLENPMPKQILGASKLEVTRKEKREGKDFPLLSKRMKEMENPC